MSEADFFCPHCGKEVLDLHDYNAAIDMLQMDVLRLSDKLTSEIAKNAKITYTTNQEGINWEAKYKALCNLVFEVNINPEEEIESWQKAKRNP